MNEKRPMPHQSAGKGRSKRAAPTIDLTAKELPPDQAPTETVANSEADPPPPSNVAEEPQIAAEAAPEAEPHVEPEQAFAPPPPQEPREEPRKTSLMAPLVAGVAGAAVMAAVLAGAWSAGLLPQGDTRVAPAADDSRIAGLEAQLQELQKRPAPVATTNANAIDPKAVDALNQRIAKLEDSLTKLPVAPPANDTALAERVTAVAASSTQARERAEAAEKAVADLRASVQDVSKTANAGASSADLAPLQQRIAALEQAAKTANADIAKATAADNAARLALSAASLRDAVLRGAPFNEELAQARALGADDKTLAPLAAYAASGVPGERALASELSALLPGMIKSAGSPPASGGFFERLQANAGQLVRVRPVDAPVGDDVATVLARLEVSAAKADIAAALTDLGKLPEAQRAPAQGWIVKAQNRQAAFAAARQYAADTARSLGSK